MAPDLLLPCGAVARDVAARALLDPDDEAVDPGHGSSCPHCTDRRELERARWAEVASELAHPESPPPRIRRSLMRRVRDTARGGGIVAHTDARGRTVVAESVIADLAARATARTTGVGEVIAVDVRPVGDAEVDLDVEVTGALEWSRPLPQVAEAARHSVITHLAAITGLPVRRIDVTFADLGPARGEPVAATSSKRSDVSRDRTPISGV